MKIVKRLMVFACVAGLLLATVWAGRKWLRSTEKPVATIVVQEQALERRVSAEGYLKAEKATPLTAPKGWKPYNVSWLLPNGSAVKSGDVVLRFNEDQYKRDLADGQDDRDSANARINSQTIRSADAHQARMRTVALATQELDAVRERAKDETDDLFSRNELVKSRIDGELSEAKAEHAKTSSRVDRSISGSSKELLKIQRKSAELTITQAKDGLQRMEVSAPHDGIFVYKNSALKLGDIIYGGQTIGELPLVEKMEAEVFVLEADAMGLEEGKKATLHLESQPSKNYKATIKKVASLAEARKGGSPTQYFTVTLALETTDRKLMKPGQRVLATIEIESDKALLLPRQCVFNVDNDWVVYKQKDSGFVAQPVVLGSGTPGRVAIKEGLSAGDVVATRDPFGTKTEDSGKESESSTKKSGATP